MKEGEERVARVTNDPRLSLGVRVSPVITETKSSPTFICKNEEKEMFLYVFPEFSLYSNGWKCVAKAVVLQDRFLFCKLEIR